VRIELNPTVSLQVSRLIGDVAEPFSELVQNLTEFSFHSILCFDAEASSTRVQER
jgi:hypothetical protein